MPPWPRGLEEATGISSWTTSLSASTLEARGHFTMPTLTPSQTYALHVATLTVSSLSIFATIITSIWFFRMRRSFRHDLIMLLIYSDMFKAFWLLLFPAVELVRGTIQTSNPFCQVSGFFLALSIEASDVAVALISVHTALYIFRGEQGLYPFRKFAYGLAAVIPILLASLAFVESPGYVNTGQFCYLPFNPMWKRLALSWIPRYLALATIFFLCVAIYIYVRVLMGRFGSASEGSSKNTISRLSNLDSLDPPARREPPATVPPTPVIKCHGLIPPSSTPSRRNSFTMPEERTRKPSISTMSTLHMDIPMISHPSRLHSARMARRGSAQMWSSSQISEMPPYLHPRRQSESDFGTSLGTTRCGSDDVATPLEISTHSELLQEVPVPESTTPSNTAESPGDFYHKSTGLSTAPPSRTPSLPNLFTILRREPGSARSSGSNVVLSRGDFNTPGTVKTREKILRQLRLLFVYPLVYVVVWILPFIVQLTGYGRGAPFGMRMASIIFLCSQGLADAVVFSLREKPWKHGRVFNVQSLKFWRRRRLVPGVGPRVGRTREEMMVDGRLARKRRDQELEDKKMERQADQSANSGSRTTPEWWDNHD